jgi:hypothetical protein
MERYIGFYARFWAGSMCLDLRNPGEDFQGYPHWVWAHPDDGHGPFSSGSKRLTRHARRIFTWTYYTLWRYLTLRQRELSLRREGVRDVTPLIYQDRELRALPFKRLLYLMCMAHMPMPIGDTAEERDLRGFVTRHVSSGARISLTHAVLARGCGEIRDEFHDYLCRRAHRVENRRRFWGWKSFIRYFLHPQAGDASGAYRRGHLLSDSCHAMLMHVTVIIG